MFAFLLLIYLHLAAIILVTYKIKNVFLRWLCLLYPVAWLSVLFKFRFDFGSSLFTWFPAFIGIMFLWAIFFADIGSKGKRNFIIARISRPILGTTIFVLAIYAHGYSMRMADSFAIEKAKEIQGIAEAKGRCPLVIQDWDNVSEGECIIMYGKIGPEFPISYSANSYEFSISVRHSMDDRLYINGGVHKELHAFRVIDSEYTDVIGKSPDKENNY